MNQDTQKEVPHLVNGSKGKNVQWIQTANLGMNVPLSDILSDLLEPVASAMKDSGQVASSEHMLFMIDQLNKEWEERDSFHERTSGSYTDSYEEGSMAGYRIPYRLMRERESPPPQPTHAAPGLPHNYRKDVLPPTGKYHIQICDNHLWKGDIFQYIIRKIFSHFRLRCR